MKTGGSRGHRRQGQLYPIQGYSVKHGLLFTCEKNIKVAQGHLQTKALGHANMFEKNDIESVQVNLSKVEGGG